MEQALTNPNSQELINESRALSGSSSGNFIPYIPVISVNNTKTEKEVDVDGVLTKVEVPAKEGFNITIKDEATNEYITDYFNKTLSAVILRVRYSIGSKHKVEPRYYSYEFDRFDEIIKVYDDSKQVVVEGNYQTIKKHFATGETTQMGKPKASFDLKVIAYIDIDGQIYRLRLNNASRSNLFDYTKTFGQNDVFTAYKTNFNLKFNDQQAIKFWYIEFERGEQVDLGKEIPLQKELAKYFDIAKYIKQPDAQPDVIREFEEMANDSDEIQVSQIPF